MDDRPLAGFIIPASCNILQHLIPGILTARKPGHLGLVYIAVCCGMSSTMIVVKKLQELSAVDSN